MVLAYGLSFRAWSILSYATVWVLILFSKKQTTKEALSHAELQFKESTNQNQQISGMGELKTENRDKDNQESQKPDIPVAVGLIADA